MENEINPTGVGGSGDNQQDLTQPKESPEEKFAKERAGWSERVTKMSSQLKNVHLMSELQLTVYTERQNAVDRHSFIIGYLSKINKVYRERYAERYNFYTFQHQLKYPTEQAKLSIIYNDLSDLLYLRDLIETHVKFLDGLIKTIDNLIYGINNRIKLEDYIKAKDF